MKRSKMGFHDLSFLILSFASILFGQITTDSTQDIPKSTDHSKRIEILIPKNNSSHTIIIYDTIRNYSKKISICNDTPSNGHGLLIPGGCLAGVGIGLIVIGTAGASSSDIMSDIFFALVKVAGIGITIPSVPLLIIGSIQSSRYHKWELQCNNSGLSLNFR